MLVTFICTSAVLNSQHVIQHLSHLHTVAQLSTHSDKIQETVHSFAVVVSSIVNV